MGHLKITHRFGSARWLDFEPYTEDNMSSWEQRGSDYGSNAARNEDRLSDSGGSFHTTIFAEHPHVDVLLELAREQPMVCGFRTDRDGTGLGYSYGSPNKPFAEVTTRYDFRGIAKKNRKARERRLAQATEEHAAKIGDGSALRAQAVATYNEAIARIVERVNLDYTKRITEAASNGERKWARKDENENAALVMVETEIATVRAELEGIRSRLRALRERRHGMFQDMALATLERGDWEVGEGGPIPEPVREAVREALAKPYASDGFPGFED